jgi:hypothetical protein
LAKNTYAAAATAILVIAYGPRITTGTAAARAW